MRFHEVPSFLTYNTCDLARRPVFHWIVGAGSQRVRWTRFYLQPYEINNTQNDYLADVGAVPDTPIYSIETSSQSLAQSSDGLLERFSNGLESGSIAGNMSEDGRVPYRKGNAGAAGPPASGWHGFKGPLKTARDHGDTGARDKHANTMPERPHLARAGARAFGEKDVAAGLFHEAVSQSVQRMVPAVLSPHRKGVHHVGREGGHRGCLEKGVTGGERKNTIS
jgi:hypothetical protein